MSALLLALARPAAAAPPEFLIEGVSASVDKLARVAADLAGRRLRLQRDLSRGTVMSRTIDGQEAVFAPLSVDGIPVVLGSEGPSPR